jgi:rRNA maturation RNase YbeY
MIKVYVKKQGNYPVSTPKLKNKLVDFFKKQGIVSDADVSILITSQSQALKIAKKHLGDNNVHNVLSFPGSETVGEFSYPPDDIIHLGEIVLCYPEMVKEAKYEGKRIDEKAYELVEHAARHLLGEHHE